VTPGHVRRVVAADGPDGRSRISEDAPAAPVHMTPGRSGYAMVNLWVTTATPVDPAQPDVAAAHRGVAPPPNGTVVRIIDFPTEPADPEERRQAYMASKRVIYGDLPPDWNKDAPHPGMHRTATLDYAIVLEGEIHAVMDKGETLLRAGDVLIQRGTNHAWSNRSGANCRMLFVLIDGRKA
jgi:hypothetical protein